MKSICLIGNTGSDISTSSGQIIRTRILYNALVENYGEKEILLINTDNYQRNAISIIVRLIISIFVSDVYIVILSGNGRKVFFPILRIFKKVFRKRVLNNIVGGDYAESVKKYPKYIKYSNSFDVNWVQLKTMKEEVNAVGINRVEVLPNSKPLLIIDNVNNKKRNSKPFKFCTFSRISKEKGIELAIDSIEKINRERNETIAELTIFGKTDLEYEERFSQIISKCSPAIHYGGVIEFDKTTDVLKDYYMLLFPTTFYGEGFPGTILDAYASGLPVIATNWKFNGELIENGKTGYVFDYTKPEQLLEFINVSISDNDRIESMRNNCIRAARNYTPENVMPIIFNKINDYRKG